MATENNHSTLTGQQIIASQLQTGLAGSFHAINPVTAQAIPPAFSYASREQIEQAIDSAALAFETFSQTSLAQRAAFLRGCRDEILAIKTVLIARVMLETGYDETRVNSEFDRVCAQLELYASVVEQGDYLNIRINTALTERLPQPRPDIRFINQALGPVVVFGASNFPLAYSIIGGDTVSALAAGCPVIVKGHNSHPGTCELVAKAIIKAVKKFALPDGTFSLLLGDGFAIGEQLVTAQAVKAVGFTGSMNGGLALQKLANARVDPIPVFAEMGSINPVVFLPEVLAEKTQVLAEKFITSLTLSAGQFCVNPGLLIAIEGEALRQFEHILALLLNETPAAAMLNENIYQQYQQACNARVNNNLLTVVAKGQQVLTNQQGFYSQAMVAKVPAAEFLKHKHLKEEVFGHTALLVSCKNHQEIIDVLASLPGQLTASVHGSDAELLTEQPLLKLLTHKVGRLVFNGFPTGVEVCEAMMHGGPFPASTDTRFTSVGTAAIARFVRPICYQNAPDSVLPIELQNANPLKLNRNVNGVMDNRLAISSE